MQRTYEQIEHLRQIRDKETVGCCKKCNGEGYLLDKAGASSTCDCMLVFKYIKALVDACIPQDYWALEYSELAISDKIKVLMSSFFDHFDNALSKGLGFLFFGPNGSGKTSLMAEIGKFAIMHGHSTLYATTEQYILSLQKDDMRDQLLNARVLLLDELDKAYFKEGSSFGPKKVEDLVRQSLRSNSILVMATNMDEPSLVEMFGDSFVSMLRRHLKFVPVTGSDFSKKMADRWLTELTSSYDYMAPTIVKAAKLRREYVDVEY